MGIHRNELPVTRQFYNPSDVLHQTGVKPGPQPEFMKQLHTYLILTKLAIRLSGIAHQKIITTKYLNIGHRELRLHTLL